MTAALRRFLVVAAAALLLLLGLPHLAAQPASAAPAPIAVPAADAPADPVVLVGVAGLTWGQVSEGRTPHLASLARTGGIASLTPRSVGTTSCPADGWLAVNSGRRAADEPGQPGVACRKLADPVDAQVMNWDVYRHRAAVDNYDAPLGLLAESLKAEPADAEANGNSPEPDDAGARAERTAAGIGPGAAIALADASGEVRNYHSLPAEPDALTTLAGGLLDNRDLVVVDLGNAAADGFSLAALDAQVGAIQAAINDYSGPGSPTLLVSSLADGGPEGHMQYTAIAHPDMTASLITSSSTRQPGLIQTPDITPTLLRLLGITSTPDSLSGSWVAPVEASPEAAHDRIALMTDRETAVQTQMMLSLWFFPVYAVLLALLLTAAVIVARIDYSRVRPWLRNCGLYLTGVPVSTFLVNLVPWQRSTNPDVAMLGALAGFALLLTLIALLGPWRRATFGPLGAIAVMSVVILSLDVLTGSRLQMSTLLGEPLLIASRFYGIGNSALALYVTTLIFAIVAVMQLIRKRWWRVSFVVLAGLAACVLLGTPGLGTKFGSVPTIIVGLSILVLGAAGIRLSVKRVLVILGSAGALMALLLFLDWLRPAESRTHFGRFFATILDGSAGTVLLRKIGMNFDILTQSWMTLLLPIIIGIVFWVLLSPARFGLPQLVGVYRQVPLLKTGLVSLMASLVVGTVINDSGIVVPAVAILFLIPAIGHLVGQYDTPRRLTR